MASRLSAGRASGGTPQSERSAVSTTLASSRARVMGPTPPGLGESQEATSSTPSATSPAMRPLPVAGSTTRETPTSRTTAPGATISGVMMPGLPVVRDLVVDMGQFYTQYEKIKPYLLNDGKNPPAREHLQMPEQREKLDGLYECILCACCSTSCPSFWWNPDKFIGPAGLLASYRFLIDSRDTETDSRLDDLDDAFSVFRCHSIMNCVNVCPKGLNPTRAIGHIKSMLLHRSA